jgi:hypothetical protein
VHIRQKCIQLRFKRTQYQQALHITLPIRPSRKAA